MILEKKHLVQRLLYAEHKNIFSAARKPAEKENSVFLFYQLMSLATQ